MPDAPPTLDLSAPGSQLSSAPGAARGLLSIWKPRLPAGVDPAAGLIQRLLLARGIDPGADEAGGFLHPSLRDLHDPSLIPDLDRAAARLLRAVQDGEPVVVYGDYDVDGITATAILYHMLRAIAPGADVRTYVPHRLEEGYGLSSAALEQCADKGARVVVSVDCGITAREPALAASAAGLDLIITDHHNPPESVDDLPRAHAVVHPRRPDSLYPFGHLSGAGVAYKLAWRLATMHCGSPRVTGPLRELLIELLAMAALGTIADIMPLMGENRVLARFGLARIKQSAIPGLRALVEASGLAGEHIDADHVGFTLGPRLNACGRMGHADEAVELFTTAAGERARSIAAELSRMNDRRRAEERRIADHACEMAEAAGMTMRERRAIVLAHEDWHLGVVGIVCSRLVSRYCRPTILMQRRDGECHGSGRSVEGFSLHAALGRCAGHLLSFGGHDMAAGLKLSDDRLEAFAEQFVEDANRAISPDDLAAVTRYDCGAVLGELSRASIGAIESLAPFGAGNPRPKLRIAGLRIAARPEPFGQGGKHLGILAKHPDAARTVRMVGWNWAPHAARLVAGLPVEVIVRPKISGWSGQVEPHLEDLMIVDPAGC